MAPDLKPVDETYLRDELRLRPGNRLHRLVARLFDTYIDDLSDERIVEIERMVDTVRITNASGRRLSADRADSSGPRSAQEE
jgi:hypothetical protein